MTTDFAAVETNVIYAAIRDTGNTLGKYATIDFETGYPRMRGEHKSST